METQIRLFQLGRKFIIAYDCLVKYYTKIYQITGYRSLLQPVVNKAIEKVIWTEVSQVFSMMWQSCNCPISKIFVKASINCEITVNKIVLLALRFYFQMPEPRSFQITLQIKGHIVWGKWAQNQVEYCFVFIPAFTERSTKKAGSRRTYVWWQVWDGNPLCWLQFLYCHSLSCMPLKK